MANPRMEAYEGTPTPPSPPDGNTQKFQKRGSEYAEIFFYSFFQKWKNEGKKFLRILDPSNPRHQHICRCRFQVLLSFSGSFTTVDTCGKSVHGSVFWIPTPPLPPSWKIPSFFHFWKNERNFFLRILDPSNTPHHA